MFTVTEAIKYLKTLLQTPKISPLAVLVIGTECYQCISNHGNKLIRLIHSLMAGMLRLARIRTVFKYYFLSLYRLNMLQR
jgi:hypothetical protein